MRTSDKSVFFSPRTISKVLFSPFFILICIVVEVYSIEDAVSLKFPSGTWKENFPSESVMAPNEVPSIPTGINSKVSLLELYTTPEIV